MGKQCHSCGSDRMEEKRGTYRFEPPANIPGGTMVIPDTTWRECENCGEQLLSAELSNKLEELSIVRQGLLLPSQIKAVRQKLGLTQTEMAEHLGVGEKTYTRWESGRSMQNKSSDNLIRLMDRAPEQFAAIEAQRDPSRHSLVMSYFGSLWAQEGRNRLAMAAHDAVLSPAAVDGIRRSLREWLLAAMPEAERTEWDVSWPKAMMETLSSEFTADSPELDKRELVDFLLKETGQDGDEPTNPSVFLEYLRLQFAVLDLVSVAGVQKRQPRGVLSFLDRIVGIDRSLETQPHRARFTTMHEIGHYVLPKHRRELWVCDEEDVSFDAQAELEQEANAFAADLLFKGEKFTREANDCDLTPESIKTLALRYDNSFEATARRFVERNSRACSLAVYVPTPGRGMIDTARPGRWQHRYTITSALFRTHYFRRLLGEVPMGVVKKLVVPGRDFADSIDDEVVVKAATGEEHRLRVSFFTNHHCIFGLAQPAKRG